MGLGVHWCQRAASRRVWGAPGRYCTRPRNLDDVNTQALTEPEPRRRGLSGTHPCYTMMDDFSFLIQNQHLPLDFPTPSWVFSLILDPDGLHLLMYNHICVIISRARSVLPGCFDLKPGFFLCMQQPGVIHCSTMQPSTSQCTLCVCVMGSRVHSSDTCLGAALVTGEQNGRQHHATLRDAKCS